MKSSSLPEVDADEDGEAEDGVLVGRRDGLNLLRLGVVNLRENGSSAGSEAFCDVEKRTIQAHPEPWMPRAVASEAFLSSSNDPNESLTASKRAPEVGTTLDLTGVRFSQKRDWFGPRETLAPTPPTSTRLRAYVVDVA